MSGEDRRQPVAKFSAPRPPAGVRDRERADERAREGTSEGGPESPDELDDDATALADAVFRAEPARGPSRAEPARGPSRAEPASGPSRAEPASGPGRAEPVGGINGAEPGRAEPVGRQRGPESPQSDPAAGPTPPETDWQQHAQHASPPAPTTPPSTGSPQVYPQERPSYPQAPPHRYPQPPTSGNPQGHPQPTGSYPQPAPSYPQGADQGRGSVFTGQSRPPETGRHSGRRAPSQDLVPIKQAGAEAVTTRTDDKPGRVPKPVKKEKERQPLRELSLTEIAGHATFTPNTVTAWYKLPGVRWSFRPDLEREALITAIAEQFAGLAGMRLHLRRTTRPFPADQWARTVDRNTAHPLRTVPGGTSWSEHLVAAQRHLHQLSHAEGETFLGITFARRSMFDNLGERVGRVFGRGTKLSERERVEKRSFQFDEVLGSFGVRARRATTAELEWLIYRSVALGMEPPRLLSGSGNDWDCGDILALTESIERYRSPYGSTVKLVNRLTGEEQHTAVLTVGRMEELEIPQRHEPWLHFHERCPWPLEISSRVDVLGAGEAFRDLDHRLRMIRSQQRDYDEHAMDAPPELQRLAERALGVGDEMTTGLPIDAARAHGWHRIAVTAETKEECLERARTLMQMYQRDMRVSLQHPKNQDWLAREFVPGEPVASTGYVRRMPVKLFAAALPQAASTVGDQRGDLIGRTAGTCRRPVFLDLHFATEVRERSGLSVFVAEPGGGKSTLMGALGYLAARRGVQVTLLDPSGPLAKLCEMPELAPYSRVLNLTGSEYGTLAPYALIPSPNRDHYGDSPEGQREYDIAVSNARSERRMLVQDICSMLLPPQVQREAATARLLRHAARHVPAEEDSSLEDIVESLQDAEDHVTGDGAELAALLLDTAEMPLAKLFFGNADKGVLEDDTALTVITMSGLRLPDLGIEREYWSAEEALALPMLHTAHRLAVRRAYGGDMNRRKLVGLDEAHFMEGWKSGRSFLVRLARDSRKWNLAALVASQNPKDILGLDVQNLVSTVFVGRIAEDNDVAAEALKLLRVPNSVGYEGVLASLSEVDAAETKRLPYREFVMRDVDGRVQRIRADFSWARGLLDYLNTTPGEVN